MAFTVTPYVIVQLGNIINAEDMLDIWKEMKINVTRIDRGTPKELKLFAKALNEADGAADKENFEKSKINSQYYIGLLNKWKKKAKNGKSIITRSNG